MVGIASELEVIRFQLWQGFCISSPSRRSYAPLFALASVLRVC
jgi:hypothetical protein